MGINSHSHSRIENSSIPIPIHELKWELIPWMGMVIPIQTQVWLMIGKNLLEGIGWKCGTLPVIKYAEKGNNSMLLLRMLQAMIYILYIY